MKHLIRGALKRVGRDIVRFQPHLIDFLNHRGIDQVIDVGANTGQFAAELRKERYRGHIISLEPIAKVFEVLRRNSASDPKWTALNVAAGARSETAQISVSENTVFSSLNRTTPIAEAFDPQARVVAIETIQVRRLDELFKDLPGSIFLKIDTQGYEAQVLAGGGDFMKRVLGVQMELPCVHLYEGVWSMAEAIKTMDSLGFTLFQVRTVNVSKTDPLAPIELDCVFGRPQ
jgi:FkbM family methyltransferase